MGFVGLNIEDLRDVANLLNSDYWEEKAYDQYLNDNNFRGKVNKKAGSGATASKLLKAGASILRRTFVVLAAAEAAVQSYYAL